MHSMAVITELYSPSSADTGAWEEVSRQTAEGIIDRTISSFNDIAKLRQKYPILRFFLPENTLLYTLYPDGGYIKKRFHTFGLEPQALKELGFGRMVNAGLKEDLAEHWTSYSESEKLSVVTYPASPLISFQTTTSVDGITQVHAWDASSIRSPRPPQEQWPNYSGMSREPR